jgi:hypothetical protein
MTSTAGDELREGALVITGQLATGAAADGKMNGR